MTIYCKSYATRSSCLDQGMLDSDDLIILPKAKHFVFDDFNFVFNLKLTFKERNRKLTKFYKYFVFEKQYSNHTDYFSIVNYDNLLTKYDLGADSKSLLRNYYSYYSKFSFNKNNDFVLGFSYAYIPVYKKNKNIKGSVNRNALLFAILSKVYFDDYFNNNFLNNVSFFNQFYLNFNVLSSNDSRMFGYKNESDCNHNNHYTKINDILYFDYAFNEDISVSIGGGYGRNIGNGKFVRKSGINKINGKFVLSLNMYKIFKVYYERGLIDNIDTLKANLSLKY